MVLRVSEHYVSTQGEGPRVGLPTQFLRFGGCNLRCPGWPCDTQHAIDPKYRNEWTKLEYTDIIQRAIELRDETGATNVCFTGGEPFLQPNDDLMLLFKNLERMGFTVECFSNGTLLYPHWATDIRFVVDWKLNGSGEKDINVQTRWKNLFTLATSDYEQAVKFVLNDESDLDDAERIYSHFARMELQCLQVFYGRVWQSKWTDAEMIEAVLKRKLPWRLNIQVHNYIWAPHERAR